MTSAYYVLDASNQPNGPHSLPEIDAMIVGNRVASNPMLIPVGGQEWVPRSSIETVPLGASGSSRDNGRPAEQPSILSSKEARDGQPLSAAPRTSLAAYSPVLGNIVGALLRGFARILSPSALNALLASAKTVGHIVVLVGAGMTVILGLIAGVKQEAFMQLVIALLLIPILGVAQFVAQRFLDAGETLVANSPNRISSPAFFECVALVLICTAIASLLAGVAGGYAAKSAGPVVSGVVGSILLFAGATVLLHPELVNTTAKGYGSAGEEAIGIVSTMLKAGLKIVPLIFCCLATVGALAVFAGFFGESAAQSTAGGLLNMLPLPLGTIPQSFVGTALIIGACVLPMLLYFLFLVQYLFLDVVRAILDVPVRLQEMRR